MNAIAQVQEQAVVSADAGTLMAVISRAASDPGTDIDKLERLLGLYERITERTASQAFDAAMSAAQSEMRPIAADANNPQTKSKYASFAALDRALRPIYTGHGFGLSFNTADGAPPDHVRLVCHVSHRDGDRRTHQLDMPNDGKGAKGGDVMTKTHAQGAAITYGQRYLLKMVFNIAVGEDADAPHSAREMGAAARRAMEAINGHKTAAEHKAWRDTQAEGVGKMVEPWEWTQIIAAWNTRAAALREAR